MFPFWESKQTVTYTELQVFRQMKYLQCSPGLLVQVTEGLKQLKDTQSRGDAFNILLGMTIPVLDLSCYNSKWVDFDNAVFELLILHPKSSVEWMHKYLCSILDKTLVRIADGTSH